MVSKLAFLGYSASTVNPNFVAIDPWYCYQTFHPHQYTLPLTPSHFVQPVELPHMSPPHQFYTTTYTPYIPSTHMPLSHVTKSFLEHMDSKITELDNKINQVSLLIEEKERVSYLQNPFTSDEAVTTCKVPISSPINDVWHKMEKSMTQVIQTLEKMGKSCANPPKLLNESILEREAETDLPELLKDDVLGIAEGCLDNTLHQQSKGTCSILSKMLPKMHTCKLFDENSERVIVQKASISIPQGMNPIICSLSPYWNLNIRYDRVMVYKLHENEYGKIDGKFYDNLKNLIKETQVFNFSSEIEWDDIRIYNHHEDEHDKVEVLVESSKHICDSKLLNKGIGLDVSLKCSCRNGSFCKNMCLDSLFGQVDKMPRKELASWNVVVSNVIKEFMHKKLLTGFCYKSRIDDSGADCITTPAFLVAYKSYFTLLKGKNICAFSPKYGLLIKLTVEYFSKMLEMNSVSLHSLCAIGRRSVAWELFHVMAREKPNFTITSVVNSCRKLSSYVNTLNATMKQAVVLKISCYVYIVSSLTVKKEGDQAIKLGKVASDVFLVFLLILAKNWKSRIFKTNIKSASFLKSAEHSCTSGSRLAQVKYVMFTEIKDVGITLDEITNWCILSSCACEGLAKEASVNVEMFEEKREVEVGLLVSKDVHEGVTRATRTLNVILFMLSDMCMIGSFSVWCTFLLHLSLMVQLVAALTLEYLFGESFGTLIMFIRGVQSTSHGALMCKEEIKGENCNIFILEDKDDLKKGRMS